MQEMQDLTGRRVAVLATHGLEYSEWAVPPRKLGEAGADVTVISPESDEVCDLDAEEICEGAH